MSANPKGRLDVLALSIAERVTKTRVEPQLGAPLWDALKPVVAEGVKAGMKQLGIPRKNLLDTDLGRVVTAAFDRTRVSGGCA